MVNPEIIEYFKKELKEGYSIDEIKETLVKTGWPKEDVEEAINFVQTETPPTTKPEPPPAKTSETKPEPQPEAKAKPLFGFILSLLAGALILVDIAKTSIPSLENINVGNILGILPLTLEHTILISAAGFLLIIGAFLAYKRWKGKISGILIIIFSIIYLISTGYIIFFIIGIVGGILALINK